MSISIVLCSTGNIKQQKQQTQLLHMAKGQEFSLCESLLEQFWDRQLSCFAETTV
jgi:hypothetical protein